MIKGILTRMTEAEYNTYIMDVTERVLINKEQEELQQLMTF